MVDNELFIQNAPRLYDTAKKIADTYRNELRAANAVGQGDLINFDYDVIQENGEIKLVFYLPKYWEAIELGRKPTEKGGSGVLWEKIHDWIQDKGIEPWVKYETKEGKKVMATLSDMTWAISKKIHNEGFFTTKPHGTRYGKHCLETALKESEMLQNEFIETAGKIIGDDFEKFVLRLK